MLKKVLLVDDEVNVTEALQRQLRKEPYKIITATSAADALKILERESIDVVISDEYMPGMNGSEFLTLVNKKYPDTMRMLFTGHPNLKTTLKAVNEGQICRFFIKPCDPEELSVAIRQTLQQKELMNESKRLLQVVKNQTAMIQNLMQTNASQKLALEAASNTASQPSIKPTPMTKVGMAAPGVDEHGAVYLEDTGEDIDALTRKIKAEVEHCERFFRSYR